MTSLDRRLFLGSSLATVAASMVGSSRLNGQEKAAKVISPAPADGPIAGPDSLFLTWQQDPTTTMTIQWIGAAASGENSIRFAPLDGTAWQSTKSISKPF